MFRKDTIKATARSVRKERARRKREIRRERRRRARRCFFSWPPGHEWMKFTYHDEQEEGMATNPHHNVRCVSCETPRSGWPEVTERDLEVQP